MTLLPFLPADEGDISDSFSDPDQISLDDTHSFTNDTSLRSEKPSEFEMPEPSPRSYHNVSEESRCPENSENDSALHSLLFSVSQIQDGTCLCVCGFSSNLQPNLQLMDNRQGPLTATPEH